MEKTGFGKRVDIDNSYAIISAPLDVKPSVHIFEMNTSEWRCEKSIIFSENVYTQFGDAVAIYGDIAVFSDWLNEKVYTYIKVNNSWKELEILNKPSLSDYPYFGFSLDIYEDYLLVATANNCAYYYQLIDSTWSLKGQLEIGEPNIDTLGFDKTVNVKISENFALTTRQNKVFVHTRSGDVFSKKTELNISIVNFIFNRNKIDLYENIAVVNETFHGNNDTGFVHIMRYVDDNWVPEDTIIVSSTMDRRSKSVGIYSDYLVVGYDNDFMFSKETAVFYSCSTEVDTTEGWIFRDYINFWDSCSDIAITDKYAIMSGSECAYIYEYR